MKHLEIPKSDIIIKKFFNLGLHMTNRKQDQSSPKKEYKRGRWALNHPMHVFQQLDSLTRLLTKILQAGGQLAVINNGPQYGKEMSGHYQSLFEGTNVTCFEEAWVPGTFTNPLFGYNVPDAVIYLTSSEKDHSFIFSEVENLKIPLFNLSQEKYHNSFMHHETVSTPSTVFFFLHLLHYWICAMETKKTDGMEVNIATRNRATIGANDIFSSVKYQKKYRTTVKKWIYDSNKNLFCTPNEALFQHKPKIKRK